MRRGGLGRDPKGGLDPPAASDGARHDQSDRPSSERLPVHSDAPPNSADFRADHRLVLFDSFHRMEALAQ